MHAALQGANHILAAPCAAAEETPNPILPLGGAHDVDLSQTDDCGVGGECGEQPRRTAFVLGNYEDRLNQRVPGLGWRAIVPAMGSRQIRGGYYLTTPRAQARPRYQGITVLTKSPVAVYDSAQARRPLITELRNIYEYRGLLRLLVVRNLVIRYKRSLLGVWWTLLNPLLMTGVMYIIFSQVFNRTARGGVPFIVYLLSGISLAMFFSQGVVAAGSSVLNARNVLTKVYVPAEVYTASAAISAAVNFAIMLVPLLVLQLALGVGIPWTIPLIIIPAFAMLTLVAGLGLILASVAVHFYDVLDFTKVLAQLMTWMIPTFYPLSMIPDRYVPIIKANPLYSYLVSFRGFVYEGEFVPAWNFIVMGATSAILFTLGVWVFGRSWQSVMTKL